MVIALSNVDDRARGQITVTDDGIGMTLDVVRNAWLVLGADTKRRQRRAGETSPRGNRPLLGEKGIGRFAAHKLGKQIDVVTRAEGAQELSIRIDWSSFDPDEPALLGEIPVTIVSRDPEWFNGKSGRPQTGTRITITDLQEPLTRGAVRELHRDILSISSPFAAKSDFRAELRVAPQEDWLEGLLTAVDVRKQAPFYAKCTLDSGQLSMEYTLRVPEALKSRIEARPPVTRSLPLPKESRNREEASLSEVEFERLKTIGSVQLHLYMFDLTHDFLRVAVPDARGLKGFLAENGGIRVYRSDIRVFGLGGKGEDWLNLGGRRVQAPGDRLSNNQVVGAVLLGPSSDEQLREQTNRRGFVENEAYTGLKKALLFAITQVEAERFKDKEELKIVLTGKAAKVPVLDELRDLRESLRKLGPEAEKAMDGVVQRVERAYEETRDMLVTAANTGLTLGGIIHDVEKQVATLQTEARKPKPSMDGIRAMVEDLAAMMDGLTFLLRKSPKSVESMRTIVASSLRNYAHRFRFHGIEIVNGFEALPDFQTRCVRRLVTGNIMNILDNAIWWLNAAHRGNKRIYIGPSRDLDRWPALVIADNGPGFADDPETLIKPFFSRKPDGMGLGLYLADQASFKQGGRLQFPSAADAGLPEGFTGAVLAIILPPGDA